MNTIKGSRFFGLFGWVCLFILITVQANAQENGKPFIHNYTVADYSASTQNWAIVQDKRGIMYIGNNDGILEYDGSQWRLISVKYKTVRSLALSPEGTIFVGAEQGEFGYLRPDTLGNLKYISLSDRINSKYQISSEVWKTYVTPQGVYFQSNKLIVRWDGKNFSYWLPNQVVDSNLESDFHFSFWVNDRLFVRQDQLGLLQLQQDSLKLIPQGELFAQAKIYTILPYSSDQILIGTENKGFFLYTLSTGELQNFVTEIDDSWSRGSLYFATTIKNQNSTYYLLATLGNGAFVIDKNGKILQSFNKNTSLFDDQVYSAFQDDQQSVWLALQGSISRVELFSPLRKWDQDLGIRGTVQAVLRYKGILYAATSLGVFYMKNQRFEQIPNLKEAKSLKMHTQNGTDSVLLVGTKQGVFEIIQETASTHTIQQISSFPTYCLYQSVRNPEVLFVGLQDGGMGILHHANGRWTRIGELNEKNGMELPIYSIIEDSEDRIWACSEMYIYQIRFKPNNLLLTDEITTISVESTNIQAYTFQNRSLFTVKKGLSFFDSKQNNFVSESVITQIFGKNIPRVSKFVEDEKGNIWINFYDEKKGWIELARKEKAQYVRDSVLMKRLALSTVYSLYPDTQQITWIGAIDGLYRYDDKMRTNVSRNYQAFVRRVATAADSTIFNGAFLQKSDSSRLGIAHWVTNQQPANFKIVLPYENNSLTFYYAAASYDNEAGNQYSYCLENYETAWSAWSKVNKKEYTNLPHGKYTFRVRAKNIHDHISEEASFTFSILPPWYRTVWAYILYFVLSVSFIWLMIWLNTKRLRKQNEILEQIVKDRTSEISKKSKELEKQKEEISVQKDLLEDKNKVLAEQQDKIAQSYKNIKLLSEIGQQVTATLSLDNIRKAVYENINALMDTDAFGIGIYDEKNMVINFEQFVDRGKTHNDLGISIADETQMAAWCLYNRSDLVIGDFLNEYKKYVPLAPLPNLREGFLQSLIFLPLFTQVKVMGVLTVQSLNKHAYTDYEVDLLRNMAVYIAIALENAETYEEIAQKNLIIEEKNKKISETTQNILDSITYASRIQNAMLPQVERMKAAFQELFVLFRPRDVVSGDFYWFAEVLTPEGRTKKIISAIDCTGHGVPGAFMSLIGNDLINEIIIQRSISQANLILNELHRGVVKALKQDETYNRDGMDLALCVIDSESQTLEFAGANNPLIYIQKGEMQEIKADRFPIGLMRAENTVRNFSASTITYDSETYCYIFSDGFPDQFGGTEGRKFMKKRLKSLLMEIYLRPFAEQKSILEKELNEWMNNVDPYTHHHYKQTDDILLIGFRI